MISQSYVKETFDYVDGELFWKESKGKVKAGDKAGWAVNDTYRAVQLDGERYYEHIIVWILHNGPVPVGMFVDHVKPEESMNNRISNLRLASRSENNCNRRLFKNNKSGVKGVRWLPRDRMWQVRVTHQGKVYYGGCFSELADATEAVTKLREKLHGKFAKHS